MSSKLKEWHKAWISHSHDHNHQDRTLEQHSAIIDFAIIRFAMTPERGITKTDVDEWDNYLWALGSENGPTIYDRLKNLYDAGVLDRTGYQNSGYEYFLDLPPQEIANEYDEASALREAILSIRNHPNDLERIWPMHASTLARALMATHWAAAIFGLGGIIAILGFEAFTLGLWLFLLSAGSVLTGMGIVVGQQPFIAREDRWIVGLYTPAWIWFRNSYGRLKSTIHELIPRRCRQR